MLPEILLCEMRGSFARSEEFLGLETAKSNPCMSRGNRCKTSHTTPHQKSSA